MAHQTNAMTDGTAIKTLDALDVGDTVSVRVDGQLITDTVAAIRRDTWAERDIATFTHNGVSYRLAETNHPLKQDGLMCNGISATVVRHD
jgi:hypothetical protein